MKVTLYTGPSIKYVTLFLANFYPLPLSHFVTHPGTPSKVCHTSQTPPPILEGLLQKTRQKPPCTNSVSIVHWGFCPGVCQGSFVWKVLSGWFLSVPVLSEYICYNKKFNITLNFMCPMYDNKIYKCDITCSLPPSSLSQTVTPSRTPFPLEHDILTRPNWTISYIK